MILLHAAALVLTTLGVITFALGLLSADRRGALGLALELWTGAGLLGLSGHPSAQAILAAALVLLVRRLVMRALPTSVRWASHAGGRPDAGAGRG